MASISLRNINKKFDSAHIIKGVDLEIADREFVVFVGPSGCGKSTLLRLISGLEEITSGELYIDGDLVNDQPPPKRGIAMVFQSYALYPHMSVYDNMAFGLRNLKFSEAEIKKRVEAAADTLQLTHLIKSKPKELSGGQRQRVAIGRTIVREPKVFLFDEPLSNLDAALRVQMRIEIAKLHAGLSATMIYVTHDQVEAMTLADKIVVLNQGNIEQVGSPLELYRNPCNKFVAGFIGSPAMNFLNLPCSYADGKLAVQVDAEQSFSVAIDSDKQSGLESMSTVSVGIRPEALNFNSSGADDVSLSGDLVATERLGSHNYLYVQNSAAQESLLTVEDREHAEHKVGESVQTWFNPDNCHLFNANGKTIRNA